jgi:hypothetical protein
VQRGPGPSGNLRWIVDNQAFIDQLAAATRNLLPAADYSRLPHINYGKLPKVTWGSVRPCCEFVLG